MAYTTIDNPVEYFNTKLYVGNGGTQSITGVGFAPDWVWTKNRSTADSHELYDIVRGATKRLISHSTAAENTETYFSSFDSDGFTLTGGGNSNGNGNNIVAWCWDANGAGSSNTAGTITSTVSANTTSGFSIVSFNQSSTGTIGHGLGVTPKMIIMKDKGDASDWQVYHASLGATNKVLLNDTGASGSSLVWDNTAPTSSVFTSRFNAGDTIAYCFAEVKGYSKFGSYTGNGSTDGTFVYTGFKPAFVLTKSSSNTSPWLIYDNKRLGYNAGNNYFYANSTNSEASDAPFDILSNGFKFRNTFTDGNGSGYTYIYMAFAENPFVSSTGIPTTAR